MTHVFVFVSISFHDHSLPELSRRLFWAKTEGDLVWSSVTWEIISKERGVTTVGYICANIARHTAESPEPSLGMKLVFDTDTGYQSPCNLFEEFRRRICAGQ